jgi:S-layer homology domain
VLAAPTVVLATAKPSWADAEVKLATAHGLMGGDPTRFRPDAPLTGAALDELVFGLTGGRSSRQAPRSPTSPVGRPTDSPGTVVRLQKRVWLDR